ncbi:MAG: metalloregulator ArsR/SmtB family transcription factor [Planctomycetota bacterium]|nr:metalloregulator ArsR/SmtB family transcription factor [Planctomycetota bacterium]RLS41249.1 MAG: ArsR family transcriptional regulator [Planctomycetota bacterium]
MAILATWLIPDQQLHQAAECLRVLAHPARLRMVELVLRQPTPVGELAKACGLTVPATSGHLRLLEHCGLLLATRVGRQRFYSPARPCLAAIIDCIRGHFN